MYQPYPSSGQMSSGASRPEPPRSVQTAVKLMYAGAAVTVLSLIASLATTGSVQSALRQARPNLTASQVHSAMVTLVTADVISAVIGIGLWIWMALANRAGKTWARILSSVLFGLDTVVLALGFLQAMALASSVISVLVWLIGLAAMVMLWRSESSAFFAAARTGGSL